MKLPIRKPHLAAIAILALGSLQMLGYLTGVQALRGIGLATGFAPFPKVFCQADGYEPFAASFQLVGQDETGHEVAIPLTAELYSQLSGPYNRRNVYGAVLAYAPRLPDELRDHLLAQALAEGSPLLEELGLPPLKDPSIRIQTREGETPSQYEFPAND